MDVLFGTLVTMAVTGVILYGLIALLGLDKPKVRVLACRACGGPVSSRAGRCPHCGHPVR